MPKTVLLIVLLIINLLAFVLYGVDKSRAKRGAWRISEKTLLLVALLGGAFGALAGMLFFRHKTRHTVFRIGLPLMAILWAVTLVFLLKNGA